ncbi:protein AUXIN RESPONSE 4 [Cinnamomum micranthum f. kanehirae]|uniref:Protein AUXIN RESPONSE 4 n=1 Tax=Cinnamomum micranthum f. kanehirae TaxID=337451 RepID=A0A443N2D7_9MAGN|nr:protein AUXIN RESPONSE 4 [Cinnamomum micranthum f. kanehirae]
MAIIQEQEQEPEQEKEKEQKPSPSPTKPKTPPSSQNPFAFWAYFTIFISILTFLFSLLSSLSTPDDKSWFLSLPNDLRLHYSKGKMIKVQLNPNHSPIEVFAIESGPRDAETLLLIHGLGSNSYSFRRVLRSLASDGLRAVAIDLPGSGFSDKTVLEEVERSSGAVGRFLEVYDEIREKGLFWGFDQLIETGQIPYEEKVGVSKRKILKPLVLGLEEMGRVIGQVVDSMGLAPVHLVLHDSALGAGAIWASESPGSVSSVTLIDSAAKLAALPTWVLGIPVVREVMLGFPLAYVGLLRFYCSRSMERSVVEAHKVLLRGRDGLRAAAGFSKGLNYSFDLVEWAGSESMGSVPVQVLWSSTWSQVWIEEGRRVADAVPRAKFDTHSGGRWPQEDAADEIAEKIARFVSSLPKSIRKIEEEPLPEHIQKMFDEATDTHHHHHHGHHHSHDHHHHDHGSHDHAHGAGFMDPYGVGHGWGR